MSDQTQARTTVDDIGVVMFTVADQDAALAFYVEKMGWEVRGDSTFGPEGQEMRWLEVAPAGSTARLALNPTMGDSRPGGSGIGIETRDVQGEHDRLAALGVEVDDVMTMPGAPVMFMLRDPDGNHIAVVEP